MSKENVPSPYPQVVPGVRPRIHKPKLQITPTCPRYFTVVFSPLFFSLNVWFSLNWHIGPKRPVRPFGLLMGDWTSLTPAGPGPKRLHRQPRAATGDTGPQQTQQIVLFTVHYYHLKERATRCPKRANIMQKQQNQKKRNMKKNSCGKTFSKAANHLKEGCCRNFKIDLKWLYLLLVSTIIGPGSFACATRGGVCKYLFPPIFWHN